MWLLNFTLIKSISMKRRKLGKEKYKRNGSKHKGTPGRGMELNPMFKKTNRLGGGDSEARSSDLGCT